MNKNPYDILGISRNSTKDDAKRAYREIALSTHPDKLIHIKDENEKAMKIEKFKEATVAYDRIINDKIEYYEDEDTNWNDILNTFLNNKHEAYNIMKDVFFDIASIYINNKIRPKSYYKPQQEPVKKHDITLEVSYKEIMKNSKKKLRLFLVDIEEPVFFDVYCGSFPLVVKQYFDEDDVEHEINVNMKIKEMEGFDNLINDNGEIDIITSLNISIKDHILGVDKDILYVDNNTITVSIPELSEDVIKIDGMGIKGGDLYIKISLSGVGKKEWSNLNEGDKTEMIRILRKM